MKIIPESEMNFGPYDEADLFYIEQSAIYKELGSGIKTVEFIIRRAEKKDIIFLEAKRSCPNPANRHESEEKEWKFEEYFSSITDKFIDSLQIYAAAMLDRYQDKTELGSNLRAVTSLKDVQLKFVLVIKDAIDIEWLAGPRAEIEERLRKIKNIWNVKLAVINEEIAREYKLTC